MVHNNPLFTKESLKAALSYIGKASFTLIYDGNDIDEQKKSRKRALAGRMDYSHCHGSYF